MQDRGNSPRPTRPNRRAVDVQTQPTGTSPRPRGGGEEPGGRGSCPVALHKGGHRRGTRGPHPQQGGMAGCTELRREIVRSSEGPRAKRWGSRSQHGIVSGRCERNVRSPRAVSSRSRHCQLQEQTAPAALCTTRRYKTLIPAGKRRRSSAKQNGLGAGTQAPESRLPGGPSPSPPPPRAADPQAGPWPQAQSGQRLRIPLESGPPPPWAGKALIPFNNSLKIV